jgi:hypothetical protein
LNKFFGSLARLRIGMEACGASHHWARELQALGHEVVLIPPQAATETAEMLGARVAETISGADIMSVQTGHMIASDPTTHLTLLASEGPSTYGNWILVVRRSLRSGRRGQSC